MEKKLVKLLANYAKKTSCVTNNRYVFCDKEENRCLLYYIPYSFGEAEESEEGEEGEKEYHHEEDLCFLLIHAQDIRKFKKSLEKAKLSIEGKLYS